MYQIAFYSLLVFTVVASTERDLCRNVFHMDSLTAAQAIRVLSYCFPHYVAEEVNAKNQVPKKPDPKFNGIPCNYESLFITLPPGIAGATRMRFMFHCLRHAGAKPGDELPLSEDIIRQRIISQASHFVNDFDENICSLQVLDEISFKELKLNLPEYGDCLLQQMLIDIVNAENVENFDFLPDDYEEENESESKK